eukprot:6544908-Pyramimonas_sp.AAC.1
MRSSLSRAIPAWGGAGIAATAKYFGFGVRPGRGQRSWEKPLSKYLDRARQWGQIGAGALLTSQAYTVYVASVLLFFAQLDTFPLNFADFECRACRA